MKKIIFLIAIVCIISCVAILVISSKKNNAEISDNSGEIKIVFKDNNEPEEDIYHPREGESYWDYTYRMFGYTPSQQDLIQRQLWNELYEHFADGLPKYNSSLDTPKYLGYYVSSSYPMKDGESLAEYTHRVFGYWPSQGQLATAKAWFGDDSIAEENENEEPDEDSYEAYLAYQKELENDQSINNPKAKLTNIKNPLSKFDLEFLKMENNNQNMIYSPLSIKYALLMLKEGSEGETKTQIENAISNYAPNKYCTNKHTSLANALFIKDSFKSMIKSSYGESLKSKYDAEIIYDSFSDVKNINNWVNKNTLGIIPKLIDKIDPDWNFVLINALAIDMRWNDLFLSNEDYSYMAEYENLYMDYPSKVSDNEFLNMQESVSGMKIEALINNYDIVKELGEENIKNIVSEDYKKFAGITPGESKGTGDFLLNGSEEVSRENYTEEDADRDLAEFLPEYIKKLDSNYHQIHMTTDFGIYVDDNVKVFSKELTKYDNTTIEYIGIMPTNVDLKEYIESIDSNSINNLIKKIKDIKPESFKEGVVTNIKGFIPKFDYEYDLQLKEDLIKLGIKDVFDSKNANLKNISDAEGVYIMDAKHKAKIEFSEEGIKAAAATFLSGGGGGGLPYCYDFDVPIEIIDLTFDKPYLYIIRDKDTEEVWFIGTVYEPLNS
ncbi:MAG: hypothetical protein IKI57_04850 [Clostridia bacterium]|nr:hypothetical protein [Clostridia bacterium]